MLEVKNLSKSFGKHEVLSDVSFRINQGKIVALLGNNGAGKSTVIRGPSKNCYF